MLVRGQLFITTDREDITSLSMNAPAFSNTIIIVLSEDVEKDLEYMYQDRITVSSTLLPQLNALCLMIDNEINAFYMEYENYLNSSMVEEFEAIIFKALYNYMNVILYVPEAEDFTNIWYSHLLQHFYQKYSMMIFNKIEAKFSSDIIIADVLYKFNFIDIFTYLLHNPENYQYPYDIWYKLQLDVSVFCSPGDNPLYIINSMKRYMQYAPKYRAVPAVIF